MNQPYPLFVTGTARSGTTLLSYMLNAHPNMMLAIDPFLPLFRSFRNAVIRESGDAHLRAVFDPASALSDYYFDDDRLRMLEAIQTSDLDIRFDQSEWDVFYSASLSRIQIECGDLAPHLKRLRCADYRQMFDRALEILAQARNVTTRPWVGFKEVWIIEFFAPLARAYPQARFIVIQRDPRAVLASLLALARRDVSQKAHVLSYLRHWRKYAAFVLHYRNHPLLINRMHILKYEDLVSEPERSAQQLCGFLDIPFEPAMLDSGNYVDYTTGKTWEGNSSFEEALKGISAAPLEQWQDELETSVVKTVEFICGPEMTLEDYQPITAPIGCPGDADVLEYLMRDNLEACSWRSDFGNLQLDYGFELFRRALLEARGDKDPNLVRRSFLFEEVYARLRKMEVGTA